MKNDLCAALDLSGKEAAMAIADGRGTEIFSAFTAMRNRDSSRLATWLQAELDGRGLALEAIKKWSIGSGPGSFTGMRLAAALVAGFCFEQSDRQCRCVPSALALAANLPGGEGDRCGALYDGRNRELLYFGLEHRLGCWHPAGESMAMNAERAAEFFASRGEEHCVALSHDLEALKKILPETVFERIHAFERIVPTALIASDAPFDGKVSELVYIRPAVFTKPLDIPAI